MVYPLDSSLRWEFNVYLENDTIRPDLFLEKITRDIEDPREFLARLFNHVLYTEDKELRHNELLETIEWFLAKRHFVQVPLGQPLVITHKCFIEMLPHDCWDKVASRLPYKSLLAFSGTCKKFRAEGFAQLARNSRFINKYVRSALSTKDFSVSKVEQAVFDTRYDLDLPEVKALEVFRLFPGVRNLRILDRKSSFESIQAVLKALPTLQGLVLANLECLTNKTMPKLALPAGLKHCTLWAEVSDTTINTLAQRCHGLTELVVCCARRLTAKAFSNKTPFTDLKKLHLYSVNYREATLRRIFKCSPKIENLHLNSCTAFRGGSLAALKFLKELNVSMTNFTGANFKALMQNASALTYIDISFCNGIASRDFEEVKYPQTLKEFTGHWTEINDNGLRNLIHTTALDSLQLTSCVRLTEEVFEEHP
ncbi:MAG: F-box protein, partial [Chlamydiales bacterium]|nr:F-box protein [Chlamydiales bacterium]